MSCSTKSPANQAGRPVCAAPHKASPGLPSSQRLFGSARPRIRAATSPRQRSPQELSTQRNEGSYETSLKIPFLIHLPDIECRPGRVSQDNCILYQRDRTRAKARDYIRPNVDPKFGPNVDPKFGPNVDPKCSRGL